MDVPNQKINFSSLSLPTGYDSGVVVHDGEKVVFVLAGSVSLTVGGEPFRLGAGDLSHFRASIEHRLRNEGRTVAKVLCGSSIPLGGSFA